MVPTIFWAYRTSYKWSTGKTPFKLIYWKEAGIPLHLRKKAPIIIDILHLNSVKPVEDKNFDLTKLEEKQ